jgi:hypothetical protein
MRMIQGLVTALAMLLAGAAMAADTKPDAADEGRGPRETAQQFFELALGGKHKEAAALGQKDQAPSRETNVKALADVLAGQKVEMLDLYANDGNALVVTAAVMDDKGKAGPLAVTLRKIEGRWRVRDIDLESDESIKSEIQRFKEKYPNAKHTPAPKVKTESKK